MIFLDNSSSSFFKPPCVIGAVKSALEFLPFNPSRASHSGAFTAGMLVYRTRKKVAEAFGCGEGRVVFTGGCTEALNLAIFGTAKKGGHIITTAFEHNSVLRPLHELAKAGTVSVSFVTTPKAAAAAVRPETYLLIVNHVSNVTGFEADLAAYSAVAAKNKLLFLVDAAQSAGYKKINMEALGIDLLAIAPHKGLHAMQGVGVLAAGERVTLKPFKYGGTGTAASSPIQPWDFPEGLEAGTLPTPAIAALNAGLNWSLNNLESNAKKLRELSAHAIEMLERLKGIIVYSRPNECGVVSFNIRDMTSQQAGDIYNEQYDIALRCGFHCAPLLHEHYGTRGGMIRASIGVDNTFTDIDAFIDATSEITGVK